MLMKKMVVKNSQAGLKAMVRAGMTVSDTDKLQTEQPRITSSTLKQQMYDCCKDAQSARTSATIHYSFSLFSP